MADLMTSQNVVSAPKASTTETVRPDWYTNYAMQVLANQQAASANPYAVYQGPRTAGFTADQLQGFDATKSAAGAYQPALGAATGMVQGAAGSSALEAASPYLTRSAQTAPQVVGDYMSPYQGAVLDRIAALGNRNLTENLLPTISDQFVGSGGFGGSRQAEAIGRAIRETQEGITAEQAKYLDAGYQSALGAAGTDLSRLGQLGSTAGSLTSQDASTRLNAGQQMSVLAELTQKLGLGGAAAITGIGDKQQALEQTNLDTAYQDFLRQQGYDQTQIDAMVKTLGGIEGAVPKAVLDSGYTPVTTTNQSAASPSGWASAASILGNWLLS
ncbi:MAG: hypothetical protein IT204_26155 [Fimbriimonadaceae bacterium]|nr:hypothetical protein [Fimbriimonadaceae bacterium]